MIWGSDLDRHGRHDVRRRNESGKLRIVRRKEPYVLQTPDYSWSQKSTSVKPKRTASTTMTSVCAGMIGFLRTLRAASVGGVTTTGDMKAPDPRPTTEGVAFPRYCVGGAKIRRSPRPTFQVLVHTCSKLVAGHVSSDEATSDRLAVLAIEGDRIGSVKRRGGRGSTKRLRLRASFSFALATHSHSALSTASVSDRLDLITDT